MLRPELPDEPLLLRLVELAVFRRAAEVREPLPLRVPLDLVRALPPLRALLDLVFEPLDLLFDPLVAPRDLELPFDERDEAAEEDFLWDFGGVALDERDLAWAITLTSSVSTSPAAAGRVPGCEQRKTVACVCDGGQRNARPHR